MPHCSPPSAHCRGWLAWLAGSRSLMIQKRSTMDRSIDRSSSTTAAGSSISSQHKALSHHIAVIVFHIIHHSHYHFVDCPCLLLKSE
eukprot:scaffold5256_cov122-Amphora_coffeaeformis.AAC.2